MYVMAWQPPAPPTHTHTHTLCLSPSLSHTQTQRICSFVKAQGAAASGIIYCLSRNEAEGVATYLREAGRIAAQHYHAGEWFPSFL